MGQGILKKLLAAGERLEELLQRIDTNGDGLIQLEVPLCQ